MSKPDLLVRLNDSEMCFDAIDDAIVEIQSLRQKLQEAEKTIEWLRDYLPARDRLPKNLNFNEIRKLESQLKAEKERAEVYRSICIELGGHEETIDKTAEKLLAQRKSIDTNENCEHKDTGSQRKQDE